MKSKWRSRYSCDSEWVQNCISCCPLQFRNCMILSSHPWSTWSAKWTTFHGDQSGTPAHFQGSRNERLIERSEKSIQTLGCISMENGQNNSKHNRQASERRPWLKCTNDAQEPQELSRYFTQRCADKRRARHRSWRLILTLGWLLTSGCCCCPMMMSRWSMCHATAKLSTLCCTISSEMTCKRQSQRLRPNSPNSSQIS